MENIRLEMRIRNNNLYRLIFNSFENVAVFCKKTGIGDSSRIGEYLNLKVAPILKDGKYNKLAEDICRYFKVLPEDIFPIDIYKIEKTFHVEEVSLNQLSENKMNILSYEQDYEKRIDEKMLKVRMSELIDSLPKEVEKYILIKRYGIGCEAMTLEQLAKIKGVSRSYIRQVECGAIQRLRHPKMANRIKEFHQY